MMMDLAATHRNIDVIQPCSHSCSKMAPDGVAEERKNADRRVGRGDNLANRRDDKFTDQRDRERGLQRRGAQREELLALPTMYKEGSQIGACCGAAALVTAVGCLTRQKMKERPRRLGSFCTHECRLLRHPGSNGLSPMSPSTKF